MSSKNRVNSNKIDYIDILFLIAPFMSGLLPVWSLALFSMLCIGGIVYKIIKNKRFRVPTGKNIVFILVYLFSFLVVEFYAVDKGMNLLAFFKNFSILLFVLLYVQLDHQKDFRDRFRVIPYSACCTVILSLLLMINPNNTIFYNGRLQGIFNYANSFGLFLLLGIFVLSNKDKFGWKDYILFFVLFLGVILTNSRAIILLTVFTIIITMFINKTNMKEKIILAISFLLLFSGIYFFSTIEKRVSSDMMQSSELITRLLYYSDAIKMIKDNPFGYGYEGWYYKQCEMQTGVYDTKFVHNSILQVILDVGIIPAIALIIMLSLTFFSKKQNAFSRMMMLLILGHSLIDIDLEYVCFIILLIPLIDFNEKEIKNQKGLILINVIMSILCVWYCFIFFSDVSYESKNFEGAVKIIPFHTEALQEILYSTTDSNKQLEYAYKVLKYNLNISGAYEAISHELVSKNEYIQAIEMEEKRLKLNKYTMYHYLTYAELLSDGINYYGKNQQMENQKFLLQKVVEIEKTINDVLRNTNPLCYQTIHTPNMEMPDELQQFIEKAKTALSTVSKNS